MVVTGLSRKEMLEMCRKCWQCTW